MKFTEDRQEALVMLRDALDVLNPDTDEAEALRIQLYWAVAVCIDPDWKPLKDQ